MNPEENIQSQLTKESIFIIGSVSSVAGRSVKIKVNKNKNSSHLIYNGQVLKNISVNSYLKITKGFTKIIGKVEGEYIETTKVYNRDYNKEEDVIERFLDVSLFGHFEGEKFEQGIKEMPLVGNESYLLDREEFDKLHQFFKEGESTITVGNLADEPAQEIKVAINKLFASHIGIFGNTGSGKSNTLARIYYELFKMDNIPFNFNKKSKFIIIDFNGEYTKDEVITRKKKVYNLNTKKPGGQDKIPLQEDDLMDLELISILANATEKTQKPFIERALNLYKNFCKSGEQKDSLEEFRSSLRLKLKDVFGMHSKDKASNLLVFFKILLGINSTEDDDYIWHNKDSYFYKRSVGTGHGQINLDEIENLNMYKKISTYVFPEDLLVKIIHFLYLQIIYDLYNDRVQNDHVAPAINKLKSRQRDMGNILDTRSEEELFSADENLIVINLKDANTETKKTLPLLLVRKLYEEHKSSDNCKKESFHIIIDEAHNILSDRSERESESWKDYRLETFEEIVKEGRKFNTFLTISSQRPQDISSTMISQLHNYFIHKLLNDFDISAIHKTVAYLDKLSFESIPVLSVGNCFFAGVATNLPVKIAVYPLDKINRPDSDNVDLEDIWK